ncbi:hypothetical protein KM043_005034 [Ampulex compressa]|nr:hypothetical protein KM043_005034 [Ampulex compressa]
MSGPKPAVSCGVQGIRTGHSKRNEAIPEEAGGGGSARCIHSEWRRSQGRRRASGRNESEQLLELPPVLSSLTTLALRYGHHNRPFAFIPEMQMSP